MRVVLGERRQKKGTTNNTAQTLDFNEGTDCRWNACSGLVLFCKNIISENLNMTVVITPGFFSTINSPQNEQANRGKRHVDYVSICYK